MRHDIPQIGMTYQILNQQGISDLTEIAKEYYAQQQHLTKLRQWSHDRYLKDSSDATAEICIPLSHESKQCSVWSINHYLGLNRHPYVIQKAQEALAIYGTGCGTSAMSGGHSQLHKDLQNRFAKIFSKEEALLFPTGFTVNSGVISALCRGSETLILIDRDSHASIIAGCRAAGSQYLPFKHNSVEDLKNKLAKYAHKHTNILVVVESAYSMEGDIAPLKEIVALKKEYKFLLYVDEAHTFGFFGKHGAGLCNELGIADKVDFIMTTLSKATAGVGGIVATSKEFASLLRWASTYTFQASIPPADVAVVDACLDLIENDESIIRSLWHKTHYLRQELTSLGFDLGQSKSPIVPVYIRDPKILKAMESELFEKGIFTIAVQYPAVKSSEGRFRFIVNNSHTIADLDHLVSVLCELGLKHGLINIKSTALKSSTEPCALEVNDNATQHHALSL